MAKRSNSQTPPTTAEKRKFSAAKPKTEEDRATNAMYSQLYYLSNTESCKARNKKWHKDNKEYHSEVSCKWAKDNPDKVNPYKNQWRKKKCDTDPVYRFALNLRTQLGHAMRAAKANKTARTFDLLGCSLGRFMEYITAHFQPGMNWTNQGVGPGKWNLDHRKPIEAFSKDDPRWQLEAFNWLNFQPLWSEDNISKNDTHPWSRQAEIDRSVSCFSNNFPLPAPQNGKAQPSAI